MACCMIFRSAQQGLLYQGKTPLNAYWLRAVSSSIKAGTVRAAKVGRVYRISSIVEGGRFWTMYAWVKHRLRASSGLEDVA